MMHFDNDGGENDMESPKNSPPSPNDIIDVEEIMMVNKSFDVIKQIKGF